MWITPPPEWASHVRHARTETAPDCQIELQMTDGRLWWAWCWRDGAEGQGCGLFCWWARLAARLARKNAREMTA